MSIGYRLFVSLLAAAPMAALGIYQATVGQPTWWLALPAAAFLGAFIALTLSACRDYRA